MVDFRHFQPWILGLEYQWATTPNVLFLPDVASTFYS